MSDRTFLSACALVFTASATVTVAWCTSMSAMGGMPMPGGWTMSMAWMPMCGQAWPGVTASFLGMWIVMMVAMMLPSLMPMLGRYRRAVEGPEGIRLDGLTAIAGIGYFAVWAALGMAIFPLGAMLAALAMRFPALARSLPFAAGAIALVAGVLQFTLWKARRLACCRKAPGQIVPANALAAWRHGWRLGLHCGGCCAGPMAILLAVGVMDLGAMVAVTAAITAERLAPAGRRVARAIGVAAIMTGALLIARAVWLSVA